MFKENPEGQRGWSRGKEGQDGRENEVKQAVITDHIGPGRNSGFYAERNESFFFFFLTALLRCNLHTIKFIHCQHTIR